MKNIGMVRARSGDHCEAMVWLEVPEVWTRCGRRYIDVHHMLSKARGGRLLDEVGETYHLVALCRRCHQDADSGMGYVGGVMIDGYVTNENGRLVYYGTDEYLTEKYPRETP